MPITKQEIEGLIPHAGDMCLLEGVLEWSEQHIVCTAVSHRDSNNPMRSHEQLGAACAVEYASQAMATHGALIARDAAKPRGGYLVGLRDVHLFRDRMDDLTEPLTIEAQRLAGDAKGVMYSFRVRGGSCDIAEGRATVILDAIR